MVARWDVSTNIQSKRGTHSRAPFSLFLMRSFFALGFCGLSLTLAGVAATLTDRDQTLAVDAMAAGLVITASAALPGILATNRR
jgi:hypothetical protein